MTKTEEIKKMKILKQEAQFEEVEIGDTVELLEDYLLIRKGSHGKVVGFSKGDGDKRIRVEFPIIEVGYQTHFPQSRRPEDRFIFAKPEELKFIKR